MLSTYFYDNLNFEQRLTKPIRLMSDPYFDAIHPFRAQAPCMRIAARRLFARISVARVCGVFDDQSIAPRLRGRFGTYPTHLWVCAALEFVECPPIHCEFGEDLYLAIAMFENHIE